MRALLSDQWLTRAWQATLFMDKKRALDRPWSTEVMHVSTTGAVCAYMETTDDADILVFRTTMTVDDILHDFDMRQVTFIQPTNGERPARVHRGIMRKYMSLRDQIHEHIVRHAPRSLLITGHSLGAGLACMAAVDLHAHFEDLDIHIVTFGAPRIGNRAFASQLDTAARSYVRVRDPFDVIPDMPGALFGFTHGDNDEISSLFSMMTRVINSFILFITNPLTHHFHHAEQYYDSSMSAQRAIVHVRARS